MRGKLLLVVGLGIGYILGARAGRRRYLQISRFAARIWNDPAVKKQVDQAEEFVRAKAPDLAELLTEGARRIASEAIASRRSRSAANRDSATGARSSETNR